MSDSDSNRKTTVRQENLSNNQNFYSSAGAHFKTAGHYFGQGFTKSAGDFSGKISSSGVPPKNATEYAFQAGSSIFKGGKDYVQAAKHTALGTADNMKGMIKGFNDTMNQGRNVNNEYMMNNIFKTIADGKAKASQTMQNQAYAPKANVTNLKSSQLASEVKQTNTPQKSSSTNKGIVSSQNKTAQSNQQKSVSTGSSTNKGIANFQSKTAQPNQQKAVSTGKSTNKGIASYQSKASGQSSSASKSSSVNTSKGSSAGSGKSGSGSSGGGKSGGSSSGGSSGSGSSSGGQSR